jgi:hypothetical protein
MTTHSSTDDSAEIHVFASSGMDPEITVTQNDDDHAQRPALDDAARRHRNLAPLEGTVHISQVTFICAGPRVSSESASAAHTHGAPM